MPKHAYRYRYDGGTTNGALRGMMAALPKIGNPLLIQGHRYLGRKNTLHEAVVVQATEGTARFSGLAWGYEGEAPKGLVELLVRLGMHRERAEHLAFQSHRYDDAGVDWLVRFLPNKRLMVLNREQIGELQGVLDIPRQSTSPAQPPTT